MRYIDNIPEPLTLDEEQDLARRIQKGSVEARNELLTHNLRWILSEANSVGEGLGYDQQQELRSFAMRTTLKAAERFEPQGFKFISYLASFLRKRLWNYRYNMDSNGRQKLPLDGVYPLRLNQTPTVRDSYANEEGWGDESWEDRVADENAMTPEEVYDKVEEKELIEEALSRLDKREGTVLRSYYIEGKTLDEIVPDIGVTRERVRQIKERALHKLRGPYFQNLFRGGVME